MAQAEVTLRLEAGLQLYVERILSELQETVVLDYQYLLELMYTVIHFTRRLFERDAPGLTHDRGLCSCADTLHGRMQWLLLLDLAVDGILKDCFTPWLLRGMTRGQSMQGVHCVLDTMQHKYYVLHFLSQYREG